MRLSPIQTGIKPNGSQGDLYVIDGKEFWLPHQVVHNPHTRTPGGNDEPWDVGSTYKGPEMSLFAFVYDGQTFHLLMDEHSSFIRDDDGYYNRSKGGHLIMINSSSHNDQFVSNACLVNVETKGCVLNRSCIVANSRRVGRDRNWGTSGPFKHGDKREKYDNVLLKKCEVIDSSLTKGRYVDSTFNKSALEGSSGDNVVTNTNTVESTIQGQRITLDGLRTDTIDVSSQGEIVIKGIGLLAHQDWRFPSIYVTNRFAFTEIDHVTRQDRAIKMVRTSPSEVELRIHFFRDGVKLALDTPRHTVEELLRDALDEDKAKKPVTLTSDRPFGYAPVFPSPMFAPPKPGETIKNIALNYLVEQVFSRLGMIQLLDEVEQTAENLKPNKRYEFENFYD